MSNDAADDQRKTKSGLDESDGVADAYMNVDDGSLRYSPSRLGISGAGIDEFLSFDEEMMMHLNDVSDLPSSIIVTNIPPVVFVNDDFKVEFEALFKQFDSEAHFEYFRTFKRCRVTFRTPDLATMARMNCHETEFKGGFIRCFFAQMDDAKTPDGDEDIENNKYLKLPPLEKQFLISPPCSPPVGWEQHKEAEPVVNFELLSRLAALAAAGSHDDGIHELHSGSEECPKIIIETCGDGVDEDGRQLRSIKFPHTPRPEYVKATVESLRDHHNKK